jgi:electron transport complex protein RnfA
MNGASWFFDMLSVALYTVFIQNLVFSGGYGASEAMRIAAKPRRLLLFSLSITYFSIVTSAICRALDYAPTVKALSDTAHAAVFISVLILTYVFTAILFRLVLGAEPKFLSQIGISALNTLVLAVPFINQRAAYTFVESLGSGIGAGVAFFLAAFLISKGMGRLCTNKDIPPAFQGTPAMFVYVALLSLAFTGFSGSSLFA